VGVVPQAGCLEGTRRCQAGAIAASNDQKAGIIGYSREEPGATYFREMLGNAAKRMTPAGIDALVKSALAFRDVKLPPRLEYERTPGLITWESLPEWPSFWPAIVQDEDSPGFRECRSSAGPEVAGRR